MADDLFVYFDGVSAFGENNGAIQIELIANVLDAGENAAVGIRQVTTAHLRCSPAAAAGLAQAIAKALDMVQIPNKPPASGTLN